MRTPIVQRVDERDGPAMANIRTATEHFSNTKSVAPSNSLDDFRIQVWAEKMVDCSGAGAGPPVILSLLVIANHSARHGDRKNAGQDARTGTDVQGTKARGRMWREQEMQATGPAMSQLIYEFDWSSTALGRASEWPDSLKAVVRILLTSGFPMWMAWGRS